MNEKVGKYLNIMRSFIYFVKETTDTLNKMFIASVIFSMRSNIDNNNQTIKFLDQYFDIKFCKMTIWCVWPNFIGFNL